MGRAKKNEPEGKAQETKVVDVKTTIRAEIDALVNERNECAEFGEHRAVKKKDKDIAEKVSSYNSRAEEDYFKTLLAKKNPLLEAAKMLRYEGIKASERKQDDGSTKMVVDKASRTIDPLTLHKKSEKGIGVDKGWNSHVEALNCILTARRAVELGIDPAEVIKNYKMAEEAIAIVDAFLRDDDPTKLDKNEFDKWLKEYIQDLVNKMTGVGEVTESMVNYLLSIYSRKSSKADLEVACSAHKYMRQYMLEICNAAATGNPFSISYKAKQR